MSCFNKCCGPKEEKNEIDLTVSDKGHLNPKDSDEKAATKAYSDLYSSLQDIMKNLENIGNKQPGQNTEEVKNFFTKIAKDHDQQIGEINNMKQKINTITNNAKNNNTLKDIDLGLKNINKDDTLTDVISTVSSNLETAITQLETSKKEKNKISKKLNKSVEEVKKLKKAIETKTQEANILAESSCIDYNAPDVLSTEEKKDGYYFRNNILGNKTKVYFLSKDGEMIKGNKLNYNKKDFNNSKFYCLYKGNRYKKLNSLNNVDLSEDNIILAHQKNK